MAIKGNRVAQKTLNRPGVMTEATVFTDNPNRANLEKTGIQDKIITCTLTH